MLSASKMRIVSSNHVQIGHTSPYLEILCHYFTLKLPYMVYLLVHMAALGYALLPYALWGCLLYLVLHNQRELKKRLMRSSNSLICSSVQVQVQYCHCYNVMALVNPSLSYTSYLVSRTRTRTRWRATPVPRVIFSLHRLVDFLFDNEDLCLCV